MASTGRLNSFELPSFCVVVENCPSDLLPVNVASIVTEKTGTVVHEIAPAATDPGTEQCRTWVVRLESPDEQRKLRRNFKTISCSQGDQQFTLTLSFPTLNVIPASREEWIALNTDGNPDYLHLENPSAEPSSGTNRSTLRSPTFGLMGPGDGHAAYRQQGRRSHGRPSTDSQGFNTTGRERATSQPQLPMSDSYQTTQEEDQHWAGRPSMKYSEYTNIFRNTQNIRSDYGSHQRVHPSHFVRPESGEPPAYGDRHSGSQNPRHGQRSGQYTRDSSSSFSSSTQMAGGRYGASRDNAGQYTGRPYDQSAGQYTGTPHSQNYRQFAVTPHDQSARQYQSTRRTYRAQSEGAGHGYAGEAYAGDTGLSRQQSGHGIQPAAGFGSLSPHRQEPLPDSHSGRVQNTTVSDESRLTVSEAVEEPQRTVAVMCQQPPQADDIYLYHFESQRNFGGDVEKVEIDQSKNIVYVTFQNPNVAAEVVKHTHKIGGKVVEVKLHNPPKPAPVHPDKLLMRNVPEETRKSHLEDYLELVTGQKPVEIVYGEEPGVVLATFPTETDPPAVLMQCEQRPVDGSVISVSAVPVSRTIMVENLNPATTRETVLYYFESERNYGGPVEDVEMGQSDAESRISFVHFEDWRVLENVLKKHPHVIESTEVVVKRYMECLGPSGGSSDPNYFTTPKSIVVKDVDKYKLEFILQSESVQTELVQQLSGVNAQPEFVDGGITVQCTLTRDTAQGRTLVRSWAERVKEVIKQVVGSIAVQRISTAHEMWPEVEKAVAEMRVNSDKAVVRSFRDDRNLVIVGVEGDCTSLCERIREEVTRVEQKFERKKLEVTDVVSNLKLYEVKLLAAVSFDTNTDLPEGLSIDINTADNKVTFHGLLPDITAAKAKMYSLVRDAEPLKVPDLSGTQRILLSSPEVFSYIQAKLTRKGIRAVWETEDVHDLEIYTLSRSDVQTAKEMIIQSVCERYISLSTESRKLLQSEDWQGMVDRMHNRHTGRIFIMPPHDDNQLSVTATDDISSQVMQELEDFIDSYTMYVQKFRLSPSRQEYLRLYPQTLQSVRDALGSHKVDVSLTDTGRTISVASGRAGVQKAREKLQELDGRIRCIVHTLTAPAVIKFLKSPTSHRELERLGKANRCVVSTEPESSGLQEVPLTEKMLYGQAKPSMDAGVGGLPDKAELPNGVSVRVVQGDITEMRVDAIVNAANGNMDHAGGLAKAIVDEGGLVIQAECLQIFRDQRRGKPVPEGEVLVSGPGKLRCKMIIHAVGPRYREGKENQAMLLHDTVSNCLEQACQAECKSIVIPALSTEFGYPAKEATRIIVESVRDFLDRHMEHTIRDLYLIDIEQENVQHFKGALKDVFLSETGASAESVSYTTKPWRHERPRAYALSSRQTDTDAPSAPAIVSRVTSPASPTGPTIVFGEIANQQVDVIVNSTSTDLVLKNGAVSSSILTAAGPGLQKECQQRYARGIKHGDVATTAAHSLPCKSVLHIALPEYRSSSEEAMLKQVVQKCLTEATNARYKSIALPVFGTGNRGYPAQASARAMLGAVHQFLQATPSSTLTDIRIIVYYKDTQIMQEFQNEFQRLFPATTPTRARHASSRQGWFGHIGAHSDGGASGGLPSDDRAEYVVDGVRLVVKQGNLVEQDTDFIVNSSNSALDHSRGVVAGALREKCGRKLEDESAAKVGDIKKKGFAITEAYNLRSRCILHLDTERFMDKWDKGLLLCLQEADKNHATSVALPALGTGLRFELQPALSAEYLFNALCSYAKKAKFLKEVRVVIFDSAVVTPFKAKILELAEKRKGWKEKSKGKGAKKEVTDLPQQKQPPPELVMPRELKLFIYTTEQEQADEVRRMLDDMVQARTLRKPVKDPAIRFLELDKMEELYRIGEKYDVEVIPEQSASQVVVSGTHSSVCHAVDEIRLFLQDASCADMYQWCFFENETLGTKRVEYPPSINRQIETAYQNNQREVRLRDSAGEEYVVNFETWTEHPVKDPQDTLMVIRSGNKIRDSVTGVYELPSHWDPQRPDEEVKLVPLQPTDPEYLGVQSKFLDNNTGLTIDVVERIQNQTLYRQYASKKAQMDRQNGPGFGSRETTLWHGTSHEAVDNINMYGFNRSYCGKNAVAYGAGVYFAIHANYSTRRTYSPPHPQSGKRYVYMCKVLVGHAVKGQAGMRVLPQREGIITYDSATDNPSNPWMYVIFNDTQAYPEYQITFH